jgi:hypothetical protein
MIERHGDNAEYGTGNLAQKDWKAPEKIPPLGGKDVGAREPSYQAKPQAETREVEVR